MRFSPADKAMLEATMLCPAVLILKLTAQATLSACR